MTYDNKGYSEEKCIWCGWRMGNSPLNCNNDDTPHVFPSTISGEWWSKKVIAQLEKGQKWRHDYFLLREGITEVKPIKHDDSHPLSNGGLTCPCCKDLYFCTICKDDIVRLKPKEE